MPRVWDSVFDTEEGPSFREIRGPFVFGHAKTKSPSTAGGIDRRDSRCLMTQLQRISCVEPIRSSSVASCLALLVQQEVRRISRHGGVASYAHGEV